MRPTSTAFLDRIKYSHKITTFVEVYNSGTFVRQLLVSSGKVTIEENSAHRRRMHLETVDYTGTLTPENASSLLAPYGNEVKVYRGVRVTEGFDYTENGYPRNTGDELVLLGIFGISESVVRDFGENVKIELDGFDRSRKVARARLLTPYNIAEGTNYGTAIQDLIASRVPGLTYNFTTTNSTTPSLAFEAGDDPWEKASKMADSIGNEIFFDASGVCIMRPVPDPETGPVVATYSAGATSMLLAVEKKSSNEQTYNHVVVTGEGDFAPVRAEAKDDDPTSPTYYLGDYGDVPFFMSSPFIKTKAQAQVAANARLRKVLGSTELLNLSTIVNPAHEAGDIIRVVRTRAKVDSKYAITNITIPLEAAQPLPVTVRKRKT